MTHAQLLNALRQRSSNSVSASDITVRRDRREGMWRMLIYSFRQVVGVVYHGPDRGAVAAFRPESEYVDKVRQHHRLYLIQVRTVIEEMLREHYSERFIHIGESTPSTPDHSPWQWINQDTINSYGSVDGVYDRLQRMVGTPQEESAVQNALSNMNASVTITVQITPHQAPTFGKAQNQSLPTSNLYHAMW